MRSPDGLEIRSLGVARGWTWTRCYLAGDSRSREAVLVDPASTDDGERTRVAELARGWRIVLIVLTHGHPDHISDASMWRSRLGAGIAGHRDDIPLFTDPGLNGSDLFGAPISIDRLDRVFEGGETITVGGLSCVVIHLPGHSPGSIGLHFPGHLISGDTLFQGSIGVDSIPGSGRLWGASCRQEVESIRGRIFTLPDDTVVHPGHGPDTTVGEEKRTNPFAALR